MLKHAYVPAQFGLGLLLYLVEDKFGDVCTSDNYKGIKINPVIFKVFETCILENTSSFLAMINHLDLQKG